MDCKNSCSMEQAHLQAEKMRHDLRALVLQSPPETPLPSENALAYKYKVSRTTARRALKQLECEELILRRNGVGSFVKGFRSVTLLLPCPDFFDEKFYPYNQIYFRYFQGVLNAVTDRGWELKTIAVSPTNNRDHIQYSLLKELHAGSMVICSIWFNRLYDLLVSKGARGSVIEMQYEDYGYQQYHKHFYTINANCTKALRQVLDYYYRQGKRRIALEAPLYTKNNNHLPNAYIDWCKIHSLPVLHYSYPELDVTLADYPNGFFKELYRQDHFDALILQHFSIRNAYGKIQNFLGLPPDIPVFGFRFCSECNVNLEPFPCCLAPCRKMAYEAVAILEDAPPRGTERKFDFEFQNLPSDWTDCLKDSCFPNNKTN